MKATLLYSSFVAGALLSTSVSSFAQQDELIWEGACFHFTEADVYHTDLGWRMVGDPAANDGVWQPRIAHDLPTPFVVSDQPGNVKLMADRLSPDAIAPGTIDGHSSFGDASAPSAPSSHFDFGGLSYSAVTPPQDWFLDPQDYLPFQLDPLLRRPPNEGQDSKISSSLHLVSFSVVPEPSGAMLLGLTSSIILLRRMRLA